MHKTIEPKTDSLSSKQHNGNGCSLDHDHGRYREHTVMDITQAWRIPRAGFAGAGEVRHARKRLPLVMPVE